MPFIPTIFILDNDTFTVPTHFSGPAFESILSIDSSTFIFEHHDDASQNTRDIEASQAHYSILATQSSSISSLSQTRSFDN